MRYLDRIYGSFDITEPVLIELIESPPLQRLKDIDQAGYFEPWFPHTAYSRFEHSMGVFLLLRKFNASLEEQIAGLIHDVSHSAFSHCIDYALDQGSEKNHSHQDNVFDEFVRNSDIPAILIKHDIDVDYILDDAHFPLKENELPDLCADRIDYSLRTAMVHGLINGNDANTLLASLQAIEDEWVFARFPAAKQYADLFRRVNGEYYSDFSSAVMFRTVGDVLRHGLKQQYITGDDLYTTDKLVLSKITSHLTDDVTLQTLWDRMNNKIKAENNPADYHAHVYCKSRAVDPLCLVNGEGKHVSDVDLGWKHIVQQELRPKEYFIKFDK